MTEIWKTCIGYPEYQVSDFGSVRSLDMQVWGGPGVGFYDKSGRILRAAIGSHGYPYVQLGKGNVRTVHSLVLENFVGPCPEGMESRHLDGNKQNPKLTNLCYGTPKENGADKRIHGTAKLGAEKAAATRAQQTKDLGMHSIDAMMRAGCATRRAVRYWEDEGLLGDVARSSGDTRQFTDEQLDKARIIAAGQFGGFDLGTIKQMLAEYDAEVYEALMQRLLDQARAAIRLQENLPRPKAAPMEFDL
jgi:DNA-binding transcriptional MerR regulator